MMAILGTSPETFRNVMDRMCKSSMEIRRVAESFLLVEPSSTSYFDRKKRKVDQMRGQVSVPKYDTCAHCEEEFEVALNEGEVCSWHPGRCRSIEGEISCFDLRQGRRRSLTIIMMLLLGVITRIGGRDNQDMTRLICQTMRVAGDGLAVASLEMERAVSMDRMLGRSIWDLLSSLREILALMRDSPMRSTRRLKRLSLSGNLAIR